MTEYIDVRELNRRAMVLREDIRKESNPKSRARLIEEEAAIKLVLRTSTCYRGTLVRVKPKSVIRSNPDILMPTNVDFNVGNLNEE